MSEFQEAAPLQWQRSVTACTICGLPTTGSGDDDAPCCDACDAANFAPAEVRPLVHWGWAREHARGREGRADGDGREAHA